MTCILLTGRDGNITCSGISGAVATQSKDKAVAQRSGVKPEIWSLHVLYGVWQMLVGGFRQQKGEGGAQQRAQAAQHHGSLWTDAPQEVHHGG